MLVNAKGHDSRVSATAEVGAISADIHATVISQYKNVCMQVFVNTNVHVIVVAVSAKARGGSANPLPCLEGKATTSPLWKGI